MLENLKTNTLEYVKLTKEEMERRGILGRLVGDCADFIAPTRNGRKYSEELWEKVFSSPLMEEKLKNRVCYGELGHPESRTEIDMEKVAVCLAEKPKKGKNGKLQAVFDILSTPNGKILKALCDYGSTLGVSSRGNGDVVPDMDGGESVDPNTYECECFDIVLIPAVESARLSYVTESLSNSKKSLSTVLKEALDTSSKQDQKIMQDTLKELNIELSTEEEKPLENNTSEEDDEAVVSDVDKIVGDLNESLKLNREYESVIRELRENLSVCYTKERELRQTLADKSAKLSAMQKVVEKKEQESLPKIRELHEQIATQKQINISQKNTIETLKAKLDRQAGRNKALSESLDAEKDKKAALVKENNALIEKLKSELEEEKTSSAGLTEKYNDLRKDYSIKNTEYQAKLKAANSLTEKYQKIAKTAVQKYIELKATQLGLSAKVITSKLSENYSFSEIDRVCESLSSYKVSFGSLPTQLSESFSKGKIKVTEKEEPIIPNDGLDDSVDEWLMSYTHKNSR